MVLGGRGDEPRLGRCVVRLTQHYQGGRRPQVRIERGHSELKAPGPTVELAGIFWCLGLRRATRGQSQGQTEQEGPQPHRTPRNRRRGVLHVRSEPSCRAPQVPLCTGGGLRSGAQLPPQVVGVLAGGRALQPPAFQATGCSCHASGSAPGQPAESGNLELVAQGGFLRAAPCSTGELWAFPVWARPSSATCEL